MAAEFRELDRINRAFYFTHTFEFGLTRLLGAARCKRLDVLDLGAGSGLLGQKLSQWAARRGWDWRFTNLDALLESEGVLERIREVIVARTAARPSP